MADTNVEIGIKTQGAEGASQTVTKVSGSVTQANDRATQAMQKSAQAQQQAASAASGATSQLQSSIMMVASWAAAMKFVLDGLKSAMADEAAFVRSTGTMRMLGLETAGSTARLRDFGTEMQAAAAIADDLVFPAFTRFLTVTKDIAAAEYVTEVAMKFAVATQMDQKMIVETLTQALAGKVQVMQRLVAMEGMTVEKTTTLTQMLDFMEQKIRSSSDAANTSEMRFKRLGMTIADVGEVIGEKVMWAFVRLEFAIGSVINFLRALGTTGMAVGSALLSSFSGIAGFMMTLSREGPVKAFQYAIDFVKQQTEITKNLVSETWKDFGDEQARMLEAWGIRVSKASLEVTRARPEDLGGGDGDGEAAALDRQAMVRLQYRTGDLQAAMDHQLSLREIELSGMTDRVRTWEREAEAKAAFNKRFADAYAATSAKVQAITMGAVEAMSGAWGDYFANKEAYTAKGVDLVEVSGRAILAFVLNQLKAELAAHAAKFASLAVANLLAGNVLGAAGNAAAAAFLGGGALLAGLGAGAVAPSAPMEVFPITEPGGGMPGGRGRGGSGGGGGSGGANTITNSTVTLNYNPVLVVNGNVYGLGDLKELWVAWNREHSFLAGEGLNTGGRG